MTPIEQIIGAQVSADPVTQALLTPIREAVRAELTSHLPKLGYTAIEAAEILGVSSKTVGELVAEGVLHRLGDRPACPITLGSILAAVDWPIEPAPVSAPLTTIPVAS